MSGSVSAGFIGWRGMVGSVLLDRMRAENDFDGLDPVFFSTSNVGGIGPDVAGGGAPLADAYDLDTLASLSVLVSTQGGDYTKSVYPRLRQRGWQGYWIDAARALRMEDDAVLVLDPVNQGVIDAALARGGRLFCGANCTVSLMLMALAGLFHARQVEWLTSMTYQAASGAGARQMRELVQQFAALGEGARTELCDPAATALDFDRSVHAVLADERLPREHLGAPLAGSLLPWIDAAMPTGQTREEWKGGAEGNKILELDPGVPIDGICVRVGSMRCHAQGFTIKLRQDLPLDEIEERLATAHPWVRVVENEREATLSELTPAAVSGTLDIPVGRLRKLAMGGHYLTAFTVGDQLLWGAAEPLRRVLAQVRERLAS